MNAQDWVRIRTHFDVLSELPREQQLESLATLDEPAEVVVELRRMLAADAASSLAEHASEQLPALALRAKIELEARAMSEDSLIGERLGPWRIVEKIGSGGMGHVYRAQRDDGRYETEAAIKIVNSTVYAERFLRERAMLARLKHPGIAALLDGGECDDGRPYLVMEYVEGEPINAYCESRKIAPLARIHLIVAAARAASYAHARAVLHLDLKPDNIMVNAGGQIKLLDFGVAKLLDETTGTTTHTSSRYFTPRYAAPEQIAGEQLSAATDVFSLAVVLYELVAGCHPFSTQEGEDGLAQRVLTGENLPLRRALKASALQAPFRGTRLRDLDAVLAKALHRDPAQSYSSMDAFADELERVLSDQPVQTRMPGAFGRMLRWARRYRSAAAALVLGVLGLAMGTVIALWQAHETRLQRDAALLAAQHSERVAEFLTEVFRAPNPAQSRGADVTARELLDRGRERLSAELEDDPKLRERLQIVIADTYRSLALFTEAENLLLEAMDRAGAFPSPQLFRALGRLYGFQARWQESESRLQQAVEAARRIGDENALIESLESLVIAFINLGQLDAAEAAAHEALTLVLGQRTPNQTSLRGLHDLRGTIAYFRGDLEDAETRYQASLATAIQLFGPQHTSTAVTLNNLATIAFQRSHFAEAEARYREVVAIQRAYYGVDNEQVAYPQGSLALTLRRQGRGSEALAVYREVALIRSAWYGERSMRAIASWLDVLELALLLQADSDEALAHLAAVEDAIEPDSISRCRLDLMRQVALQQLTLDIIGASADCLDAHNAPTAMRAFAWLTLARASASRNADATEALLKLDPILESITPPDPYLNEAHAQLTRMSYHTP